jgi:hypothetical protein
MSYENMELVASHGGTPYISFKVNATAARGGTMARMFHPFNFNKDEYLAHFHKRSNVESTFSMTKAKFGDSLRSRTDTAMVNEALCKVLCHNRGCLIQSACELGIEAKFWGVEISPRSFSSDDAVSKKLRIWIWIICLGCDLMIRSQEIRSVVCGSYGQRGDSLPDTPGT